MSFFAILLALLLEQARPLGPDNAVHRGALAWVHWAQRTVDAGQRLHGWLAWFTAAVVPALLSAAIYLVLDIWSGILAFAWLVAILYVTLGFRQFSHHFTAIREALESGDEARAREILAYWREVDVAQLPRQELLRHVIEHAMVQAHRHVFGVLVCFVVFAALGLGPAGAVLYRLAEYVSRSWTARRGEHTPSDTAGQAATQAWRWTDAVPVRVTAVALAVVGNFEEAVASWRQDARHFPDPNDGILLAATAGAINVRLGGQPLDPALGAEQGAPVTDGRTPQLAHLASVVGLVWRSVVLCLLLLALGVLARLV